MTPTSSAATARTTTPTRIPDPAQLPPGTAWLPPFYALRIVPGDLGAKGGLVTDARARVLRPDDSVLPGLYAAGNAGAAVRGRGYAGAGSTIGPAMAFGYVAAPDIAGELWIVATEAVTAVAGRSRSRGRRRAGSARSPRSRASGSTPATTADRRPPSRTSGTSGTDPGSPRPKSWRTADDRHRRIQDPRQGQAKNDHCPWIPAASTHRPSRQ